MSCVRLVLGNSSLADYLQGGGHWMIRIQYLLGLRALGHDAVLLELLWSTGNPARDDQLIDSFFARLDEYGLKDYAVLLLFEKDCPEQIFERARVYGRTQAQVKELILNADVLWNDCCGIRQPLLGMFRHRVFLDGDPGHLQVSALTVDVGLSDHHAFLTVGKKLHDADCQVPTLGLKWHTFTWFVYLPLWEVRPDQGPTAPFTSVTHWSWGGELWHQNRLISTSKRDAYLRYLKLPEQTARAFELAVNIDADDQTGDRELLEQHGWKTVDPWKVAKSPSAYQQYLATSRAEISCPKPIFRELNTGWFSDRSACYLASGRPVLAEDTGISDYLPTGEGLVVFNDLEEAIAGVTDIDSKYERHMRAARKLAEDFLDSQQCLPRMLAASS